MILQFEEALMGKASTLLYVASGEVFLGAGGSLPRWVTHVGAMKMGSCGGVRKEFQGARLRGKLKYHGKIYWAEGKYYNMPSGM